MKFWTKLILVALCVGYFSLNMKAKREAFDLYTLTKSQEDFKKVFIDFHDVIRSFEKRLDTMETRLNKVTNPRPTNVFGNTNDGTNVDLDTNLNVKKAIYEDLKAADEQMAQTIVRNAVVFENEDRKIMSILSDMKKQIKGLKAAIDQSAFDARSFQVMEINKLKDWASRTFQQIGDFSDRSTESLTEGLSKLTRDFWINILEPILSKMPPPPGMKPRTVPGPQGPVGPPGMPGIPGMPGPPGICDYEDVEKTVDQVLKRRFGPRE